MIAVTHPEAEAIFNRVTEEVRLSRPKYDLSLPEGFYVDKAEAIPRDYDTALAMIRKICTQEDASIHPYLNALSEAINRAKSHAADDT